MSLMHYSDAVWSVTASLSLFSSGLRRLPFLSAIMDGQRLPVGGRGAGASRPPQRNGGSTRHVLPPLQNFAGAHARRPPVGVVGGAVPPLSVAGLSTSVPGAPAVPNLFSVMPMSQDVGARDFTAASFNVDEPALRASHVGSAAYGGMTAPMRTTPVVNPGRFGLLANTTDPVGTGPIPNPVGDAPVGARPHVDARAPVPSGYSIGVASFQTPEQALAVTVGAASASPSTGTTVAPRGPPAACSSPTPSAPVPPAPVTAPAARTGVPPAMAQGVDTGTRDQGAPFAAAAARPPRAATPGPEPHPPTLVQGTPALSQPAGAASGTPAVMPVGASLSVRSLMPVPPPPPHRPRLRKRAARAAASASPPSSQAAVVPARPVPGAPPPLPAEPNSSVDRDGLDNMIKDAVSKGIREGMRGLQLEVTNVRRTCEAMSTTLSSLCTTVNAQGIGTERTAVALQDLSGAVHGGFSSVMGAVEPAKADAKQQSDRGKSAPTVASLIAAADRGDEKAIRSLAAVNETNLKHIRQKYQALVKRDMFAADVSAKSFPSTALSRRLRVDAVQAVMNVNVHEGKEYLDSRLYFFVQNKTALPVKKRVCSKLTLTLPHFFQAMKRLIVPVFLKRVGSSKKELTSDSCALWKENCVYATSHKGREGIAEAIRTVYRKERMLNRIVSPTGVGQVPYVRATYGVFAMMCMLLRSYFDDVIAADAKNGKVAGPTGGDTGMASDEDDDKDTPADSDASQDGDADPAGDCNRMMYNVRWQAELHRLNPYVPRSTDVLYGISLIDGDSIYRAAPGPPEGNTPSDAGS